jgi:hypothetical protein
MLIKLLLFMLYEGFSIVRLFVRKFDCSITSARLQRDFKGFCLFIKFSIEMKATGKLNIGNYLT